VTEEKTKCLRTT